VSCGGGGGGGSSSPVPTSQGSTTTSTTTATTATTAITPTAEVCDAVCFQNSKQSFENLYEYQEQYGLGLTNASSAYARGATGAGVVIGVLDSGLDVSHQEITASKVQSGSYLSYSDYTPSTRQKRHGTEVASIAAGVASRAGSGSKDYMHGVAFDAKIFFIAVQLSEPDENYDPIDLGDSTGAGAPDYSGTDNFFDQVFEVFIDNNVDIINNSFGFSGNINSFNEAQLRSAFPNTIDRIAQDSVPEENKTLFVWAAGNAGSYADQGVDYSSPEVFPGMAQLLPELQGHSLAVVSVNEEGVISDFSNRCGISKDYCIAAPGEGMTIAYPTSLSDTGIFDSTDGCVSDNSCYAVGSGTSFAAPFVAGGLALLSQHFNDQLGNTELLNRILMTADKTGVYSDETIYGQGLIDLDAATKPIGNTMVATSFSLDNMIFTEAGSSIGQVGSVMGDSLINAIHGQGLVVFDSLGAPFFKPLTSLFTKNLPSLAWLSSELSNASQRISEINTQTHHGENLTLGIASNNFGEHDFTKSLWAKNDKKLRYFAFQGKLSESSTFFIGKGTSPSLYFGADNKYLKDSIGRSSLDFSPFLDFVSNGSFMGSRASIGDDSYISGVLFKGTKLQEEHLLIKRPDTIGFMSEYKKIFHHTALSLQVGFLKEPESFMGGTVGGAFGSIEPSKTFFTGLQLSKELPQVYLTGSIFLGDTTSNFKEVGLISSIEDFNSSSFNFGIFSKKGLTDYDSFGFQIYQPLRLEKGSLEMSIPVGRTKSRRAVFENLDIDLVPTGREINFQFIHRYSFHNGNIYSRLGFMKDGNHVSVQENNIYFSTNFEYYIR